MYFYLFIYMKDKLLLLFYLKYCTLFVYSSHYTWNTYLLLQSKINTNFGLLQLMKKRSILVANLKPSPSGLQIYLRLLTFWDNRENGNFIIVLMVYNESPYQWYIIFFLHHFWLIYGHLWPQSNQHLWLNQDMKSTVLILK